MSLADATPTLSDENGAPFGTSTNPLSSSIIDGSLNGPVAVKLASTVATAADKSLVVAISPNSPVLHDGINTAKVLPPSTVAVATDRALVVAISPNNPVTITPVDPITPTYSAVAPAVVSAAAATDVFTITGTGSGKVIRVREMRMMGKRTTAGDFSFEIVKRSTANSGGTSVARTIVPHDSTNPVAAAVVRSYSANPTLGTLVGSIRTGRAYFSGNGASSVPTEVGYTFGGSDQAVALRSGQEVLAMNFRGQDIAGCEAQIYVEWTEE